MKLANLKDRLLSSGLEVYDGCVVITNNCLNDTADLLIRVSPDP